MLLNNDKKNHYDVVAKKNDPVISVKLPAAIVRDLVLRSEENGTSITLEIASRLARTLERDLEMLEQDDKFAYIAFKQSKNIE